MACCGLDFGTSNSVLGWVEKGEVRLAPLEDGKVTIPSAVFYPFDGGRALFGRQAIGHYVEGEDGRLMRALKSVLGTSLMHEVTRVKQRELAFGEILGGFLGHLKRQGEMAAGYELEHVVLGRPVHFVDDDAVADATAQDQLARVARACGFGAVEFQFEPIAAALDYERVVRSEELALIVDIGGGTADFSVVRVGPARMKAAERKEDILANVGVHLGGTDIDRLLSLAVVMPELGFGTPQVNGKQDMPAHYYFDLATWQRINRLYGRMILPELRQVLREARFPEKFERLIEVVEGRFGHALAGKVEAAKVQLTEMERVEIELGFLRDKMKIGVGRDDLAVAIGEMVGRLGMVVREALQVAGVARVDAVFLTGGTTQVPVVRREILRQLGLEVRVVEGDIFGSVGMGLALEAERKFG